MITARILSSCQRTKWNLPDNLWAIHAGRIIGSEDANLGNKKTGRAIGNSSGRISFGL